MFIRSQSVTIFVVFILSRRIASVDCSDDKQEVEEKNNDGLYIESQQRQDTTNSSQHDLDYSTAQTEPTQDSTEKPSEDEKTSEQVALPDTSKSSSDEDKDDFEVSDSILKASHKALIQRLTFGSRKSDHISPPLLTGSTDPQDIERRREQQAKQVKHKSNKNHEPSNQNDQSENESAKRARVTTKLRFFKGQSKKIPSLTNLLIKPKKVQESPRGNDTVKSGQSDRTRSRRHKHNLPMSQNEQIEQALALDSLMNPLGSHPLLQYPAHRSPPGFLAHQPHPQVFPYSSHHGMLGPSQLRFLNHNLIGQEASVSHHLYHNPQVHGAGIGLAYGSGLHPAGGSVADHLQKTAETSMPIQFESSTQSAGRGAASGGSNKNSTAALNAAAAAVLLGERAKSLLNQMTMSNAAAVAAAAAAVAAKNSNLLAESNANNNSSAAASSSPSAAKTRPVANLDASNQTNASMMAAPQEQPINEDTWPAMTLRQHAANSHGEVMAGAPTMMLEHTDEAAGGPLDFDTQLVGGQAMHGRGPADVAGDGEDEPASSFYAEDANAAKMAHAINPHSHLQPRPPMMMPHNPMDFYEDNGPGEPQEIMADNYNEPAQPQQVPMAMPVPPAPPNPYGAFPMGGNSGGAPMHMVPPNNHHHHGHGHHQHHQHSRHEPAYPDSINAIKQKSDARDDDYRSQDAGPQDRDRRHSKDNLINLVRDRLSASSSTGSSDQIRELIKELQELDLDSDSGRKSSSDKGTSQIDFDDYEDLLGKDDEEDRRKALRRKIIAKIRSKYERQAKRVAKELLSGGKSSSNDDSIRIPLHALLLAALDRRASSSESSNRHIVLPDESESTSLVNDDQSRYLISDAQRQFADDTADLAPLLNATKMIESSVGMQQSSANQQQPALSPTQPISTGGAHKELLPIESSLTLPSGPLSQTFNGSGIDDISLMTTVDNVHSSNHNNLSVGQQVSLQPPQQQPQPQQDQPSNKTRRAPLKASEGDFDLDEQAERYSRDDRRELEPAWMRRDDHNGHAAANNGRRSRRLPKNDTMKFEDFEDDYEQMDRSARRKMRAKLRKRLKRPPNRSRRPTNEASYLDDGQRFIDNVTREASASKNSEVGPTDVDKNIANMDTETADDRERGDKPARARPLDYDDEYDERMSRDSGGEDDYPGEESSGRKLRRPAKRRPRKDGHSDGSASWKPSAIDDEVKRIEADARDQEDIRRERSGDPATSEDQPGDDNGGADDNDEQESVMHEQKTGHNGMVTNNGPRQN